MKMGYCVCVCVREIERGRERDRERGGRGAEEHIWVALSLLISLTDRERQYGWRERDRRARTHQRHGWQKAAEERDMCLNDVGWRKRWVEKNVSFLWSHESALCPQLCCIFLITDWCMQSAVNLSGWHINLNFKSFSLLFELSVKFRPFFVCGKLFAKRTQCHFYYKGFLNKM